MSLALFTILADLLSRMIVKAELEGRISGVKISRISPRVTHLLYADDLVIYCKATSLVFWNLGTILRKFCMSTGQVINWDKSSAHFSKNVSQRDRVSLCWLFGIQECSHKGLYLDHPFCNHKSKSTAYRCVMDRLSNKLSSWKAKALTMVGRLVLVKLVA